MIEAQASTSSPSPMINLNEIRPKPDGSRRGRRLAKLGSSELRPKVRRQVATVADDVGLIDREHGITDKVRLAWDVAVRINGDQLRRLGNIPSSNVKRVADLWRLGSPVLEPEFIRFDIK